MIDTFSILMIEYFVFQMSWKLDKNEIREIQQNMYIDNQ